MSLDSGREVFEAVAGLSMAGFHDGQDRLHEAAATGALGAERQLPPDYRRTQGTFADVVGRLDSLDVEERPKPVAMAIQRLTHPDQLRVAAEHPAQQQAVNLSADWSHQTQHSGAGNCSVSASRPVTKKFACGPHQVAPQAFHLMIRMVDQ